MHHAGNKRRAGQPSLLAIEKEKKFIRRFRVTDGFWNSEGSRGRIAFIIPVMSFISKVISPALFFLLSHCFPATAATFPFTVWCGGAGPRVTAFGDVWVWHRVLKRGGGHIQSPPSSIPRHVAWPGCSLQGADSAEALLKLSPSGLCHPRTTSAPSSAAAWDAWAGSRAPLIPTDVLPAPPAPGAGSAAAPSLAPGRTGPGTGFYFPSPPFMNNLLADEVPAMDIGHDPSRAGDHVQLFY